MSKLYARGREAWTKEAVWRKLNAFCNVTTIRKHLERSNKNEEDIMFAIKTARSFLNNATSDLATALIENYYGCFWMTAAMVMIKNDSVTLKQISDASSAGHGLMLDYKHDEDQPLNWKIFIQPNGFMGFILKHAPFDSNLEKVCLPNGIGKRHLESEYEKIKPYGYDLDSLISRMPELEWHYELLTGKPTPTAYFYTGEKAKVYASKRASEDFIKSHFPNVKSLLLEAKESESQSKNHFQAEFYQREEIDSEKLPLLYSSLLTDVNAISKLDKPLDNNLLWHILFSYSWSIVARYTPFYLQRIENGNLSDWKPFLDEYTWFLRIRMPTACLNHLTSSDWRFSPPSLYGG
jgi:hypothetical protein